MMFCVFVNKNSPLYIFCTDGITAKIVAKIYAPVGELED